MECGSLVVVTVVEVCLVIGERVAVAMGGEKNVWRYGLYYNFPILFYWYTQRLAYIELCNQNKNKVKKAIILQSARLWQFGNHLQQPSSIIRERYTTVVLVFS